MCIRAITSQTKKGLVRQGYRLVRSDSVGGKIRQTLLLNLGVGFGGSQEPWPRLVELIACRYRGLQVMEWDPELMKVAAGISLPLRTRGVSLDANPSASEQLFAMVGLNTLDHAESPRQVGANKSA